MPSTALPPRTIPTAASVIALLVVATVATAPAVTAATASGDEPPQQATATGPTAETTANATVYVTSGDRWDDLQNASAVARLVEGETPVRTSTGDEDPVVVTLNDTMVVAVTLPGLGARLDEAPGENTTERMRSLVEAGNASLSVVQQNPSPERAAMVGDLLGSGSTRVVAGDGDTAYLVVDVDEVAVEYDTSSDLREKLVDGPYYDAIFRVDATLDGRSASTHFLTQPAETTVPRPAGAETALLTSASNATLHGRSNLAPGTTLQVSVVDESGRELVDSNVTVDGDGRFATAVDTRGLANSTLEARVALGSTAFEPVPVAVRRERATVALSDQTGEGHRVVVDEVALSHGGLLVVRRNASDGPIVGVTEVGVGERSDVALTLEETLSGPGTLVITAYRDVNANGAFEDGIDETYGTSANATYQVESGMDLTATATVTPTVTSDGTTEGETDDDTAVSRDDAPGLGVTSAMVALLVTLVVGRLRRAG